MCVCVVCAMFMLCTFSVIRFVFVGFCVMCELQCLPSAHTVGRVSWCLLCDGVCILCCVPFCVLCCFVFSAVRSVICWFNVRGGVYVVVCVFPVCREGYVCVTCAVWVLCCVRCMFCVYFSVECCVTGAFVGGSVLGVVCLECVFVCCVFGVFCVACCVRGWDCYVVCEWVSFPCLGWCYRTCVSRCATYCVLSCVCAVCLSSYLFCELCVCCVICVLYVLCGVLIVCCVVCFECMLCTLHCAICEALCDVCFRVCFVWGV